MIEHILIREDGNKVKITAFFTTYSSTPKFETNVRTCLKGKRTWVSVLDTDSFSYRRLDRAERTKHEYQCQLDYVTKEELLEAKLELWQSIKPMIELDQQ